MKKIFLLVLVHFLISSVFSQNNFDCDTKDYDSIMTSTEKCIIKCIKEFPINEYLGKKDMKSYDSIMRCTMKEIVYGFGLNGNFATVIFRFTDDLQIRFFFDKFLFLNPKSKLRKIDKKLVEKEVPSRIQLIYITTILCEITE